MHGEAEEHYQYPDDAGFWDDFRKWSFRQQVVGIFVAIVVAYLVLCAITGAAYGVWWGTELATMSILGLTLVGTVFEAIIVAFVALAVGGALYLALVLAEYIAKRRFWFTDRSLTWAIVWVVGFHLIMTISLAPLKRDANRIYEMNPNPPLINREDVEGSPYHAEFDYGGQITAITIKRDVRIKRYGYVGVFEAWDVSGHRGGNTGVYLFVPGYALLSDWVRGLDGAVEQTAPQ